jgi:uncharacterized protein
MRLSPSTIGEDSLLLQVGRPRVRLEKGELRLSASDLGSHLGCDRITALNILASDGALTPPVFNDPALEALQERGFEHEEEYLDHLETLGSSIIRLDPEDYSDQAIEATLTESREIVRSYCLAR